LTIETAQDILTQSQVALLRTLLYFDVFSYPLSEAELYANAAVDLPEDDFRDALNCLERRGLLRKQSGFLILPHTDDSVIERRQKGNEGATRMMPEAQAYSMKIAAFPFVEGICLSGGLSKNYYDKDGDIDYLIMTRSDRLWVCRTLLIIRYKLLPASRKRFWCINYFIGASALRVPDTNYFVSTELSHLIPTVNYQFYEDMLNANSWYLRDYPNKARIPAGESADLPSGITKRTIEWLLSGAFGAWLDDRLLAYTLRRWRSKYPEMSEEDFELQFRSRKNVCKRHTHGFQNKVLTAWEEKIRLFEVTHALSLRP